MKNKNTIWVVGIVLVIVALLVWGNISSKSAFSSKTNREIAMTCQPGGMAENFHIHPQLKIVINGTEYPVSENIGVTRSCMHPIHTHKDLPNIHVEAPEKRDFTLGDFFAVWNKSFSKEQIMEYKADGTHSILMTVNGKVIDTYENTVLRDKDLIVISYENK